jgi:hypothetical protein
MPFAAREYHPQAIPELAMSIAPASGGAAKPGESRYTSPPDARVKPSHSEARGLSPRVIPMPIIVICTAAKRINAPTPAFKER